MNITCLNIHYRTPTFHLEQVFNPTPHPYARIPLEQHLPSEGASLTHSDGVLIPKSISNIKKLPSDQISILVTPHSSFTESRFLAVEFYSLGEALGAFLPQKQNRGTCRAQLNH